MSKGTVNKVILIGNIGDDPRVTTTNSGVTIASVRLATTQAWKNKDTGNEDTRTEWHTVDFFGRLGEIVRDHARKGTKMYVEGNLRTRTDESTGTKRYFTSVVGQEMQFLGAKSEASGQGQANQAYQPPNQGQPNQGQPNQGYRPPNQGPIDMSGFDDDDVPF